MLMLSRWRDIGNTVLVALLVMSCTSCARWREAKVVVAEAERLLAKGEIMQDTAVLTKVINTLDNPVGRVIAKDELAEAYYLMGRNMDDYCHDFAAAADYYIEADRLQTTDLVLRGRINSCMGFLCKQDSCFVEALEFYERSSHAFKESGNEWYYAHNLLNVAEQHVCLCEYAKADSVLQIAGSYDIDSAYHARMVDVKALALYNQEMYDSALVHLLSIKDYPRPLEAKCFNNVLIIRCYNKLKNTNAAISYAEYIIEHSKNPAYRSNAYFILIQSAGLHNDVDQLSKCSNAREDEDRKLRHISEAYAQASAKLKDHLQNPYPFLYLGISVCVTIILGGVGAWIYRKKNKQIATEKQQMEAELRTWKESIQQNLDTYKEDIMSEKRMIIRNIIMEYADEFAIEKPVWNTDKDVFRLADSCFGFVIYRLKHKYCLRNSELKICLMVLLDFPTRDCIKMVTYTEKSFPTIKRRLAEKLGTSSGEMRDFLIDFIAKII